MSEYRISYNPFTKDYISGGTSHSIQLYNRGRQSSFDEYIRGIILDDVLYLRVFYPYNNIDELTRDRLYQASYELLKHNTNNILEVIKNKDNITVTNIKYNVDNDLLRGLKLINI
jgi:hypothetical protein